MENFGNNSANKLFERMPELTYLEEWASLLAQVPEKDAEIKETSLVIFRLSDEWFALPTLIFSEIGAQYTINSMPYYHDPAILGVINLKGQLRVCFSLHVLLDLKKSPLVNFPRFLAISDKNEIWTTPVDEVKGIYQYDLSLLSNVPVDFANMRENFLKGVINWNEKNIYLINDEILFSSLRRRIS